MLSTTPRNEYILLWRVYVEVIMYIIIIIIEENIGFFIIHANKVFKILIEINTYHILPYKLKMHTL